MLNTHPKSALEHSVPESESASHPNHSRSYLQPTLGEIIRGVTELSICVAVIVLPVFAPRLLAIPLMAAGAFTVLGLALWDDRAR